MKINWTKVVIAALVIIAVILLLDKCTKGKVLGCNKPVLKGSDTIYIKKDSVVYRDTGSHTFIPTLIRETRTIHDTITKDSLIVLLPDSAIINDWYIARQYKDTIEVAAGKIITDATVFKNQLQELTLSTDLKTIERTTTIVANPLPKSYPLISGGVFGGYVWGAKIGGGWKDKRDRIFKIDYNRTVSGQTFIGGEVLLPIRFKRK